MVSCVRASSGCAITSRASEKGDTPMDTAIIFLTHDNQLAFVLAASRSCSGATSAQALDNLRQRGCVPLFVTHAPSTGRASRPFFRNIDVLRQVMLNRADEFWRAVVCADTAIAFA